MLQRSHVSWAKKIAYHAKEGEPMQGLLLFCWLHRAGKAVTAFVLSAALKASARLRALDEGKEAHCFVLKHGFQRDIILMTSLLDMYSKCSCLAETQLVFHEMPERDVIATNGMITALCRSSLPSDAISLFDEMPQRDVDTWNSLVSGLAQLSKGEQALYFFKEMRLGGERADFMTMTSVLSICADMAAVANGKQIHGLVVKHGFEAYAPVGNATIDMYSKGGSMDDSSLCFNNMPVKNIVSWTSLIVGFGKHGLGMEALQAFDRMECNGIIPNKVTFLGTLSACSHSGLVEEGWRNFNTMIHSYSFTPDMEHYTCMVDLLARAGRLSEAWKFIDTMPVKPDAELWTAFLRSCSFHMNVELTKFVGEKLLELKPREGGAYILLSNFYGVIGDLEGMVKIRRLMLDRGIRKEKARTWIEINRTVHAFESGDMSHPSYKEIYNYLEGLIERIRAAGYVPNTGIVVQSVEDRIKEEIILGHSEKLAIGMGLISTPPGTRIMIVKNLRVCMDCHTATAFISKVEGREIIARDASRFHRFKEGLCSCGNHW